MNSKNHFPFCCLRHNRTEIAIYLKKEKITTKWLTQQFLDFCKNSFFPAAKRRLDFRKTIAALLSFFFWSCPFLWEEWDDDVCRPSAVRLQRRILTMGQHHCCRRYQSQYSLIFWLFDRPPGVIHTYPQAKRDNNASWYMFGKKPSFHDNRQLSSLMFRVTRLDFTFD